MSKQMFASSDRHSSFAASALQVSGPVRIYMHVMIRFLFRKHGEHQSTTTIAQQVACQSLELHHLAFARSLHVPETLEGIRDVHPILGRVRRRAQYNSNSVAPPRATATCCSPPEGAPRLLLQLLHHFADVNLIKFQNGGNELSVDADGSIQHLQGAANVVCEADVAHRFVSNSPSSANRFREATTTKSSLCQGQAFPIRMTSLLCPSIAPDRSCVVRLIHDQFQPGELFWLLVTIGQRRVDPSWALAVQIGVYGTRPTLPSPKSHGSCPRSWQTSSASSVPAKEDGTEHFFSFELSILRLGTRLTWNGNCRSRVCPPT